MHMYVHCKKPEYIFGLKIKDLFLSFKRNQNPDLIFIYIFHRFILNVFSVPI